MSKFIGRRSSFGIGKESPRGTAVAPSYWLNVLSFSHNDKVTKARKMGTHGGIWGGSQALVANKWAEGDVEVEMGDKSFGLILLAVLGTESSAVLETTAYTHTYTLQNDNQHDSLSLHINDPDRELIFKMSMIESLVMTFVPDELVKYTVSFKSRESVGYDSTVSYAAENKFLGRHLAIKFAAATGDLAAASETKIKSLTLTFNKNLEIYNALGSVQPNDILNKLFTITGEIELLYENDTMRDYMLDGSYKAVRLDLVNSDVTIGATSNPAFRLDLSKCDFEGWDADYAMDDIVSETITFTALYDDTNENVINSCYVINELSTDY